MIRDLRAKLETAGKQRLATEAVKIVLGGAVAFTGTAAFASTARADGSVWEPPVGQSGNYTVVDGDSLWSIASHYQESLQQLESANPSITDPSQIYPNEVIFIPAPGDTGQAPTAATPTAATPTPAAPTPVTTTPGHYTVAPGDTLWQIAQDFGVSVDAIAQANGITDPSLIQPGQDLIIPGSTGGPVQAAATTSPTHYTVASGDTLWQIAQDFGVSVDAIAQANGITDPSLIQPGQDLIIPGSGGNGGSSPTPTPAAGNVATWIAEANAIQSARGVPYTCLDPSAVSIIIQHESNGNPNAINLWDSNAKAGHPSMGLMQTIMPTFLANATPGYAQSPYNPVDDIMAGENYACSRYGSVDNVPGVIAVREGRPYVGY